MCTDRMIVLCTLLAFIFSVFPVVLLGIDGMFVVLCYYLLTVLIAM